MSFLKKLFKKKPFNAKEELDKIQKTVDDAWLKYEKNPNRINTLRLDGLLDITERLVRNLENLNEHGFGGVLKTKVPRVLEVTRNEQNMADLST